MSSRERARFLRRSREFFESLASQVRSAGHGLACRLDDVRSFLEMRLARGRCPYCGGPLGPGDFVLDLQVPPSRGGRFTFRNLDVLCSECQAARGPLIGPEFRELLLLAAGWAKPVRNAFLARLRAGTATGAPLPPRGSLEWFTGSAEPHPPAAEAPSTRGYRSPFPAVARPAPPAAPARARRGD